VIWKTQLKDKFVNKMKSTRIAILVMQFITVSGWAFAQTATSNLTVTANVQPSCQITNVGDISFGTYDPLSATPKDADGSITFRCVKGTSYKAYIVGTREMTGGVDTITFELYSDAGRSSVFESDNSGGSTTSTSINPIVQGIYGRIEPGQDVTVASYSTTLVATVESELLTYTQKFKKFEPSENMGADPNLSAF
jgi:spore coat protein U-like protein